MLLDGTGQVGLRCPDGSCCGVDLLLKNFGKYHLVRKISSGGMADVYCAREVGIRGFSKIIAIKRIYPHLLENKRFVRMFTDEAKIASQLMHPNVVQIHTLGEEEGVPFIVMDYLAGRDLNQVLKLLRAGGQRLPVGLACRVVIELCKGLHYAHEFCGLDRLPLEIVHRDVSPRNILIGFNGAVKITDFGVARARDREEHTEHGVIKGKIRYISPEAAGGATVDRRSDLYAVGAVFVEMLTMRPLYDGANEYDILVAIREGRFDRGRLAEVPEDLKSVILRALEHKPEARYSTAKELLTDLQSVATGSLEPMSGQKTADTMGLLFARDIEEERHHDQEVENFLSDMSSQDADPQVEDAEAPFAIPDDDSPPRKEEPETTATVKIPPLFEGLLSETSFTGLMHQLSNGATTGRLDLCREPIEKSVFFSAGDPITATSNMESELFGQHLVDCGLVPRFRIADALDCAARKNIRLLEALLEVDIFPPHELYLHLGDHVRDRILELFTWTRGRFAFHMGVDPDDPGFPLGMKTHDLIYEGVHERVPMVAIKRSLKPHRGQRIQRVDRTLAGRFQLSGREQRILRTIADEGCTLSDLIRRERNREQVQRLVYLLQETQSLIYDPA